MDFTFVVSMRSVADEDRFMLMSFLSFPVVGARLVAPSISAMLREVFKLKNLRRAKGPQGSLVR